MLPKIKREKFSCGLDLGVQTMKAGLVRAQDMDNLELLGVHEMKTTGLKDSAVSDLNEFSDCIQKTVTGLSHKTGFKIKTVHIPTLVISGDHEFIPSSTTEHISRAIPNSRLVTLKDCGHFTYLECPVAVREQIDLFFAGKKKHVH